MRDQRGLQLDDRNVRVIVGRQRDFFQCRHQLIAHSDRFVLVDGAGHIRGYYHGLDAGMPDEMVRDLAALAGER